MRKFRYPVDTDQFQKIKERGLLYVDKTNMMFKFANEYEYVSAQVPQTLIKCGVSISSGARNITHWRIVDQDGNTIDEQHKKIRLWVYT